MAVLREWLAAVPGLEFKLDPQSTWTPELFSSLRSLGRVRVLDLKGAYKGTLVDQPFDAALYRRVGELASAGDPPVYVEDPALDDGAVGALGEAAKLVSWDAPIHSAADIEALPFMPAAINIKPSRFGSVERLLAAVEYCGEHGIPMYGGGQFELGPGRDQIQALASVFYPDAANDVAPGQYNVGVPRAGDAGESPAAAAGARGRVSVWRNVFDNRGDNERRGDETIGCPCCRPVSSHSRLAPTHVIFVVVPVLA